MSNYLDHLVSRSFGHADQVKPRLPSLFEPLPETMGFSSTLTGEDSISTIASTLEATESGSLTSQVGEVKELQPQTQTQTLSSPALSSSLTQESSSPVVQSSADPHLIQDTPQSQTQPVLSPLNSPSAPTNSSQPVVIEHHVESTISTPQVIEHHVESIISTPQSTAIPTPQAEASSARETALARPDLESMPTAMAIAPVTGSAMSPAPVQEAPAIHPAVSPALVQEAPTIRPAVAMSFPETSVSPLIRSLSPEPIAPQSAPPAPTIHVTIGRIEVRATPPAPTQAKPRPASPVMNLDEYLRQRGGAR